MGTEPREELAAILGQAQEYLEWLKDEGAGQVEVSRAGREMSVPVTKAVKATPVTPRKPPVEAPVARLSEPAVGGGCGRSLAEIASDVSQCQKCGLHKTRTRTVPGQGTPTPEIMFVGEAPGADEDAQGLAFVGAAGQLLTKMIEAMGLCREEVFIANILKCRPPGNRPPTPEEMEICMPYLKEQIRLLKPRVIVALGGTAVRGLLKVEEGVTRVRGHWHKFEGIDVMPTLHPSYLLRNPPAKRDAWEDLKAVLKHIGRTPPAKKPA